MRSRLSLDRLLLALCCLVSLPVLAEAYKPIFSEAVLAEAAPEARARMEALEAENRTRWQAKHASAPTAQTPSARPPKPGQLYRYTDSAGVTHFSRNPPAGFRAVPVHVRSDKPSESDIAERQAAVASEQAALRDFDERRRIAQQQAQEREERRRQANDRAESCLKLYNEIEDYRRGGVVYYDINDSLDERGEREYWTDSQVAAEAARLEKRYESQCGSLSTARPDQR